MRCVHESKLWNQNSFITLTYEDTNIPEHGSLRHRDFQLFLKRLRKHAGPTRVRFYMCGEYGGTNPETGIEDGGKYRPHYHACLFNWDWPDKQFWRTNHNDDRVYKSELLDKLWGHGLTETGDVTFESAAYVARYCMAKLTGKLAKHVYGQRTPEYNKMSLKPGIGAQFFHKYHTDIYPHDHCIIRGKEVQPPKYYDKLLKRINPDLHAEIKETREWDGYQRRDDNTNQRLDAKRQVIEARMKLLKRNAQ